MLQLHASHLVIEWWRTATNSLVKLAGSTLSKMDIPTKTNLLISTNPTKDRIFYPFEKSQLLNRANSIRHAKNLDPIELAIQEGCFIKISGRTEDFKAKDAI